MGRMECSEGGGKWDNCNSIINKYIKKERKKLISFFFGRCHYFIYNSYHLGEFLQPKVSSIKAGVICSIHKPRTETEMLL